MDFSIFLRNASQSVLSGRSVCVSRTRHTDTAIVAEKRGFFTVPRRPQEKEHRLSQRNKRAIHAKASRIPGECGQDTRVEKQTSEVNRLRKFLFPGSGLSYLGEMHWKPASSFDSSGDHHEFSCRLPKIYWCYHCPLQLARPPWLRMY
jgi:hypothetical protein